jgi:hypothetical protein
MDSFALPLLKESAMGVVFVSNEMLDRWSPRDKECFVCGHRGDSNPCDACRELAVQAGAALGGDREAQAALVALGADPEALRAELAELKRNRRLLAWVAELGAALPAPSTPRRKPQRKTMPRRRW